MNFHSVYDATGRIVKSGKFDPEINKGPGESTIIGLNNDANTYVVAGVATDRPDSPVLQDKATVVADGIEEVTFSLIPNPSTIRMMGPEDGTYTVTDGSLEISFEVSGVYIFKVESFPDKDKTFMVEAT